MDDKTTNEIPEYVKNLLQAVQDFVFAGEWENRTGEVAKKYSLNDTQTDDLINTTLYVLIGLESPDTFLQTIITDLGVSRPIAEQIMADLETNVFEYAISVIGQNQTAVTNKTGMLGYAEKNFSNNQISAVGLDKKEITKKIIVSIRNNDTNISVDYVNKLPKSVQNFVFDGTWETRVEEIAKKYSLNNVQEYILIDTTLCVLIGLDKPDTFLETIISFLGISKLLAEQIVGELETRVFDYALNTSFARKIKAVGKPEPTPISALATPKAPMASAPALTPEVRPTNLPATEVGEIAHNYRAENKIEIKIPVAESPRETPKVSAYTPTVAEPVQRPVSVPRFIASSDDDSSKSDFQATKIEPFKIPTPKDMLESKLTGTTVGISEKVESKEKTVSIPTKPASTYKADPYREPLD